MGLRDTWRETEQIAEAGKTKVAPIALEELIKKGSPKSQLFADLMRIGARSGSPDAVATKRTLERILDNKTDASDLPVLVKYHAAFTEHMQKTAKAEAFLSESTIKNLGEHSEAFKSLNALFGSEGAAKSQWDDQLLFLSINQTPTFDTILDSVDRFTGARKRSRDAAEKFWKRKKFKDPALTSVIDEKDSKKRRETIREEITEKRMKTRFGRWRNALDKYLTGGAIKRLRARMIAGRIGGGADREEDDIKRDRELIGDELEASVQGTPTLQRAFVLAARGDTPERSKSFKDLQEYIDFEPKLKAAWRPWKNTWESATTPLRFARLPDVVPVGAAAGTHSKETVRQDFLAAWKREHETEVQTSDLDAFWKPIAIHFLGTFSPDLSSAKLKLN